MSEINLKITTNRLDNRKYQVTVDDGTKKEERLIEDASAGYAVHVVLRDYVVECATGTKLHIHTNSHSLILDIEELLTDAQDLKILQRILKRTSQSANVELASISYTK